LLHIFFTNIFFAKVELRQCSHTLMAAVADWSI